MAQYAFAQVALAPKRIDQGAVLASCHGVDCQIATAEILLERDTGRGVEGETSMASPTLSLGAGQRVFLVGFRVQEHGEITPNRPKAKLEHRFRSGAHNHVVVVGDRSPEHLVAHRATDAIDLHFRQLQRRSLE